MRDYDLEIYSALLKRPSLCMGTNDWNGVEKFIRAYELGSRWECDFMNLLTDQLRIKYGIPMPSEGLIKQMQLIATDEKINWEELFVAETKEILIKESDENDKFRFKKLLEKKILEYFHKIPEYIDTGYFINLNQIYRQIEDWHGKSLSLEQRALFTIIKEDILKESYTPTNEKIKMSAELKNKILELKQQLKNER